MTDRKDWLSGKDKLENAKMLDWMHRADDERFIKHHHKAAELIAYNFERGMSRAQMVRIWGHRLVDTVVGVETTKSVKDEEPKGSSCDEKVRGTGTTKPSGVRRSSNPFASLLDRHNLRRTDGL